METKFNVGDEVYARDALSGQPFVIFAPIHSIEITEEVFGLETLNLENIKKGFEAVHQQLDEQKYINNHTKKATVVTYVFKIQDSFIKIPEYFYLHSTGTNEVKQLIPLVFATKEEFDKVFTILK